MPPKNSFETRKGPRTTADGVPLAIGLVVGLAAIAITNKYIKDETAAVLSSTPPSKTPPPADTQQDPTPPNATKIIKARNIKIPDPEKTQCSESKPVSSQNDDESAPDYPILYCNQGKQPPIKIYQILDDLSQAVEYPDCTALSHPLEIIPIETNTKFDVDLELDPQQPFLVYFPEKETPETINGSTICQ
ncbi:hypothetical protein IT413_00595 [Candidatus Peregrinibacteria bacterium]|nr:hypothetical protein [Candidatus Peregrinibacteria bacterium]